jgi:hypothetical protein
MTEQLLTPDMLLLTSFLGGQTSFHFLAHLISVFYPASLPTAFVIKIIVIVNQRAVMVAA